MFCSPFSGVYLRSGLASNIPLPPAPSPVSPPSDPAPIPRGQCFDPLRCRGFGTPASIACSDPSAAPDVLAALTPADRAAVEEALTAMGCVPLFPPAALSRSFQRWVGGWRGPLSCATPMCPRGVLPRCALTFVCIARAERMSRVSRWCSPCICNSVHLSNMPALLPPPGPCTWQILHCSVVPGSAQRAGDVMQGGQRVLAEGPGKGIPRVQGGTPLHDVQPIPLLRRCRLAL